MNQSTNSNSNSSTSSSSCSSSSNGHSDVQVMSPSEPVKSVQITELAKKQQFQDDQVAFKGVYDAVESKRESFDTLLLPVKIHQTNIDRVSMHRPCPTSTDKAKESVDKSLPEVSGREKLKRHRVEVAGQVWIPDIWGQEELLKDWIDCSAFDASLIPTGIMSARAALIQESVRRNSGGCVKS